MRPATARGILTGILYYYYYYYYYHHHHPADIPPPEKSGNVNIFMDLGYQMRGAGGKLVTEALVRRPTMIRTSKRYSEDSLKFRLAGEGQSRWD